MASLGGAPKVQKTPQEAALAEVSAEQYNNYVKTFAPVNEKLIGATQATEARTNAAAGASSADTAIAFSDPRKQILKKMDGSGRTIAGLSTIDNAYGEAAGAGQGVAVQGVHDNQQQGNLKLAAFGRGIASDTTLTMAGGVNRASYLARSKAEAAGKEALAKMDMFGTIAGGGLRVGKEYMDTSKLAAAGEEKKKFLAMSGGTYGG